MNNLANILQVSRFYFDRGGAQACFMALNKLLIEKGHKVVIIAGRDSRNLPTEYDKYFVDRFADDNLSKASLKQRAKAALDAVYSIDIMKQTKKAIHENSIQLADVHNIFYQISPSVFKPLKEAGIPILHHLHDYAMFCANGVMEINGETCRRCINHKYHEAVINKCYHDSILQSTVAAFSKLFNNLLGLYDPLINGYVVTSEFQRKLLAEWGIDYNKMCVIPLFFDGTAYPVMLDTLPRKQIIFFGEMKLRKGPQLLYEAAKRFSGIKFIFIGSGPMKTHLQNQAIAEKVLNVEFHDFMPKEKLFQALQQSLFTVVPSIFFESFGRVIIESFHYGKPVIGSNLGSIPEVIQDGVNGLLFTPGDCDDLCEKIEKLLSNGRLRNNMGKSAKDCVDSLYSKDIYYGRLQKVYQSLLDRNS